MPADLSLKPRRRLRPVLIAGLVGVVGASIGLVVAWQQNDHATTRVAQVRAIEDTFVELDSPSVGHGEDKRLVASNVPGSRTAAYLKFDIPNLTRGRILSARVEVTAGSPQGGAELLSVPDTTWSADDLPEAGPPQTGPVLATATPARTSTQDFDVTAAVQSGQTLSVALRGTAVDRPVTWFSTEHGRSGPRVVVVWAPDHASPAPSGWASGEKALGAYQPGLSASSSASPSTSQFANAQAQAAAPLGALPQVPRGRTLIGATVRQRSGETYQQAVDRADRTIGPMRMVRVFYPGLPQAWGSSRADLAVKGNRPIVVSFKADPRDILSGSIDGIMSTWFAKAPRTVDIYWTYFHEPEDDIARGAYSAADFRAAWRHLVRLAKGANNHRLYSTLVLMCWSLEAASGRNWRDYYPGDDAISVLGWDCYNDGGKKGVYWTPEATYRKSIEVSKSVGKPFGYAEMGSIVVPGDAGGGRASWIQTTGRYLIAQGSTWVAYWDDEVSEYDYRLLDSAGQQAWRGLVNT